MEADEIKHLLAERSLELCQILLPGGKQQGGRWVYDKIPSDRGHSVVVDLSKGLWRDFSGEGQAGSMIDLIVWKQGFPNDKVGIGQAFKWAREWLGIREDAKDGTGTRKPRRTHLTRRDTAEAAAARADLERKALQPDRSLVGMVEPVAARWAEGLGWLRAHPEKRERIARERGWPVELVEWLDGAGLISAPRLDWGDDAEPQRGVEFHVQCPRYAPAAGVWVTQVGYHQRWFKDGSKAWYFAPNEKRHGCSVPALPFVVGDVRSPWLAVFLEGQWDAITFAHAAGLFADAHEGGISVFGVRGAQGLTPLFQWWGRWLQEIRPQCWLIGDNDAAGQRWLPQSRWRVGDSFSERLARLGLTARVSLLRPDSGAGKDFNDAWKTHRWEARDIYTWMESENIRPPAQQLAHA
jgi:hypothetical protein